MRYSEGVAGTFTGKQLVQHVLGLFPVDLFL